MDQSTLAQHLAWQGDMLPRVSRTFALTIPVLPGALENYVGNAYLLCRIADAIEDDPGVSPECKRALHERFIAVLEADAPVEDFEREASSALTEGTIEAERELVADSGRAIAITRSFPEDTQASIARCVRKMCTGMPDFQHLEKIEGLETVQDLDRYCYFVAGVVGEMLTELFCAHAEDIAAHGDALRQLDRGFGLGLQMTNILKDVWEDAAVGSCWLPRDLFAEEGYDLREMHPDHNREAFNRGMRRLTAKARGHLQEALDYTLLIPAHHRGIRLFCLWSLGLSVLTIRRIAESPRFRSAEEVKVSRRAVGMVLATTRMCAGRDGVLRFLFERLARGIPEVDAVPAGEMARSSH